MRRAEQIASAVAWTLLAAFLFALFGLFTAHAVATTLVRLGAVAEADAELVGDLARAALGLAMLGVALVYRRLAETENAGSLAAWLSGWGLLLYSLTSLASLVDEQAGPIVLLGILSVWAVYRLSKYFARYDPGGPDDKG